jgi:hypothetical protein
MCVASNARSRRRGSCSSRPLIAEVKNVGDRRGHDHSRAAGALTATSDRDARAERWLPVHRDLGCGQLGTTSSVSVRRRDSCCRRSDHIGLLAAADRQRRQDGGVVLTASPGSASEPDQSPPRTASRCRAAGGHLRLRHPQRDGPLPDHLVFAHRPAGQAHVVGLSQAQQASERISRDLRVSDPLVSADANDVTAKVYRTGACEVHRWYRRGRDSSEDIQRYPARHRARTPPAPRRWWGP